VGFTVKPERPKKYVHDDKSLCPRCNTYVEGQHEVRCDPLLQSGPGRDSEPVESKPTFLDGVLFAMGLLKEQIDARTERLRGLDIDNDTSLVMNGVQNVLSGVRINFETELMKRLHARQAEHQEVKPK
jgi:hypothetical protein